MATWLSMSELAVPFVGVLITRGPTIWGLYGASFLGSIWSLIFFELPFRIPENAEFFDSEAGPRTTRLDWQRESQVPHLFLRCASGENLWGGWGCLLCSLQVYPWQWLTAASTPTSAGQLSKHAPLHSKDCNLASKHCSLASKTVAWHPKKNNFFSSPESAQCALISLDS